MRGLSNEKMVSLSKNWISNRRKELEGIPQVSGILADLDAAHKRLLRIIDSPAPAQDPTEVINKSVRAKDKRHDNLLRAGYYHLGSLIALSIANDDEAREDELVALRKLIYPRELTGTTLGYDEQEGSAVLVESRLNDAVSQQLKEVRFSFAGQEQNLLEILLEQISLAKEIMDLLRQRKQIESAPATAPVDERNARNAWIEVARTLSSNLRLAVRSGGTTQELADSLLQELSDAESEERRERAARKQEALQQSTPETKPPIG